MKSVIAELKGESPYSQSRPYTKEDVPALSKELHDAYEKRTWRNRMHVTSDGRIEIPGATFANCIKEAAKRLSIKIPGKGQATYTKSFEAGVMVTDPLVLDLKADDVKVDKLFVPSDGKRGGGKRVWKYFPRIDEWSGKVTFFLFDDVITEDIFRQVLAASGMLVGIGRFRPQNCGFYGRFSVKALRWQEEQETLSAIAG
jgi:hypothetical protein